MNYTTAAVQAEFRRRLWAKSATERLRMMSGMFSTAKTLALAATAGAGDNGDPAAVVVFERMYRSDFSADELAAISEHLRTTARVA